MYCFYDTYFNFLMTYESNIGGLSMVNGVIWEYLTINDSEFFYHEIFINNSYFDDIISIQNGNTIIDAGANIGLFSLYCLQKASNLKVYAFEPIPKICDVLRRNLVSYNRNNQIVLENMGLAECEKTDSFFYFNNSPGESCRNISERSNQRAIMENFVEENECGDYTFMDATDDSYTIEKCNICSLRSYLISKEIETVDLLKVILLS